MSRLLVGNMTGAASLLLPGVSHDLPVDMDCLHMITGFVIMTSDVIEQPHLSVVDSIPVRR